MSKIGLMCSPDWCAQVQRNPAHWDITCPSGYLYELLRCRDGSSKSSRRLRLPDLAALHRKDAVQEHQEANQGCGKQHPCVPAEPGKVQADLLSEIPPGAAEPGRNRSNRREKSSGSYKKAHSSRAASVLVFWEMSKPYLMRSSGWYLYQAPHQAQHSYSRCRWFSAPCVLTEFLLWYFPWHGKTRITHCLVRVI